jgi:hypothetical protein
MQATKIFLSYRRDDSSGYAGRMYAKLAAHYGAAAVFRDIEKIVPMDRFREVIQTSVLECAIVLVIISKHWANLSKDGVPRIAQPDDVLCWEISTALSNQVPVLPVLVGGARMPSADHLPPSIRALAGIVAHEMAEARWDHDFEELVRIVNKIGPVAQSPTVEVNPFAIRGAIRDDAFFHDRLVECRMLRDYVRGRQNCQLVGPRRIGKSSVLLYVQRHAVEWVPTARAAYVDLQDPRCATLQGWLNEVARGLNLPKSPAKLTDFMEAVEDLLTGGVHPVLCLDEFGEMTRRPEAFPRDVFLTLRACGQRGMSILTGAPKRLSELTDPKDDVSPFFNTFPVVSLRGFSDADARSFVERERDGIPSFTATEINRILEFAQGHPAALQAACFHVLAARLSGDGISDALAHARDDVGRSLGS